MSTEDLAAAPPSEPEDGESMPVGAAFTRMTFGSAHVKIGFALWIAFAIESWEMLTLAYVTGDLQRDLHIGTTQVGFAISALFFGMIPGSLLGDRWPTASAGGPRARGVSVSTGCWRSRAA